MIKDLKMRNPSWFTKVALNPMTSVCMIPMRRQKRWQRDSGAERCGPKPKKPDATRRWKKQRTNAPLEPVEVAQPCQHTDFMLLASRTGREHISVALIGRGLWSCVRAASGE